MSEEFYSFKAAVSIPAYTIVRIDTTTGEITPVWTSTAQVLGVAQDAASTNDSVPVALDGQVAKVICNASIAAGSLIAPVTATGYAVTFASTVTTTALNKIVGKALTSGSSNSTIDIIINPNYVIY